MMRIAVLASHGGSILQAVIDAIDAGTLAAELVLVASNNSNAYALQRASEHNIPTAHLSSRTHPDPDALDAAMADTLANAGAQWVVLAGYMKKLGPITMSEYHNRILNTHPALLPKYGGQGYYGRSVHEAVLAAGEQELSRAIKQCRALAPAADGKISHCCCEQHRHHGAGEGQAEWQTTQREHQACEDES